MHNGNNELPIDGNGLATLRSPKAAPNLDALSEAIASVLSRAQTLAGMYGDAISETHRHLTVELWRGLSHGSEFADPRRCVKITRRAIDASFSNAIAATQLATKLQLESLAALKLATLSGLGVVDDSEMKSALRAD
jgi:hypothetical protein